MMNRVKGLVAASSVAVMVLGQSAFAALDESVETAVTATTADITEAGGLMIGLTLAYMAIRWVIRVFR